MEHRNRNEVRSCRSAARAADRPFLHATSKHAGVSIRAAAAKQSPELRFLYAEREQWRELWSRIARRVSARQPLGIVGQPLVAAHALSRCERPVLQPRDQRAGAAVRAR